MPDVDETELRRLYQCILHDAHDGVDREEMFIKEVGIVLSRLTAQKCKEARIDELNKQLDSIGIPEVFDDFTDGNATAKRVMYSKLESRIAELNGSGRER